MDLYTTLLWGAGAVAVIAVAIVAYVANELRKPPPHGGSPFTLPNGMRIQHWQKAETDFLYTEIFGKESAYAREGIKFGPGATIVDAGANIGMFSLYACVRCEGEATVHAFEPMPSTFNVLKANAMAASKGGFDDVIKPAHPGKLIVVANNVGLSDTHTHVTFEHHPHFSVWSTSDAKFAADRIDRIVSDLPRAVKTSDSMLVRLVGPALIGWVGNLFLREKLGKTERVPAELIRLSDYIDQHKIEKIDLLKVDVEGAEQAVLRGISDAHWARVQQVVLEVESFASKDAVCDLLGRKGFTTSWFASERERNPGVTSEVCMVYAHREGYTGPSRSNRRA